MKNPSYCDMPHCRRPIAILAFGFVDGKPWVIRLCESHRQIHRSSVIMPIQKAYEAAEPGSSFSSDGQGQR